MAKIVYNNCFGGFSLSREAVLLARELSGNPKWGGSLCIKGDVYTDEKTGKEIVCDTDYGYPDAISRHDPILVQVVEQLGSEKASGSCAELAIYEVSNGTAYRIEDYDGNETVHTQYDIGEWAIAT